MTELVPHVGSGLAEQMGWAEALAQSDLVPGAFRNRPANVLLAISLGRDMGLSPSQALMRINVIQGKPTASAELILSNVRKAGHLVRFRKEPGSVTCLITRADDPEWEHSETFTMDDARALGLTDKGNWKSQPQTMLKWRALTAAAREACPEALFGVVYTDDELDARPAPTAAHYARPSGAPNGNAGNAPRLSREAFTSARQEPQAQPVAQDSDLAVAVEPSEDEWPTEPLMSSSQRGRLFALFTEKGITDKARQVAGINEVLGLVGSPDAIVSRGDLTATQAAQCIAALERLPTPGSDQGPPGDEPEALPLPYKD